LKVLSAEGFANFGRIPFAGLRQVTWWYYDGHYYAAWLMSWLLISIGSRCDF
jgi:hypothetical protein